jgi:hypothetical protein
LESYLQTSTGPYPPGPHSTSSYRSTGSPVPSTVDFDVRSTFSTDSTPFSVGGEGSKMSSPAPSRGGSGGGSVSVGGKEETNWSESTTDESGRVSFYTIGKEERECTPKARLPAADTYIYPNLSLSPIASHRRHSNSTTIRSPTQTNMGLSDHPRFLALS